MRKLSSLLFLALLAFVGAGCDSNDDASDADRFVGTWTLSTISDSTGDQTAIFNAGYSSVKLTNNDDGTFSIVVTPKVGAAVTLNGTYTVVESGTSITLRATVGTQVVPLNFTYTFASDTQVSLKSDTTTTVLLNNVLGTTLQGQVTLTVTK